MDSKDSNSRKQENKLEAEMLPFELDCSKHAKSFRQRLDQLNTRVDGTTWL